jgi:hypothetical protein
MTPVRKTFALAALAAAVIGGAIVGGAIMGGAIMGGAASAQVPAGPTAVNPWVTLAPFPEGSEEVLGATAGSKLYVLCGLGPGFNPLGHVY